MRIHQKALFLTLILLFTTIKSVLAINEYGEDEEYLGQVVDSYLDNSSVASVNWVVYNDLLDCMELDKYGYNTNFTILDYTSYFETFPTGWTTDSGGGGTISRDATHVFNGSWSLKCYDPNVASYGYGYQAVTEEAGNYIVSFQIWVENAVQPDNIQIMGLVDVGVSYNINPNLDYHDGDYYIVNRYGVGNWEDVSVITEEVWTEVVIYFNDTSNKALYYIDGDYKGEFNIWSDTDPDRVYVGDGSAAVGKGFYWMDDLLIGKGNLYIGYLDGEYYTKEMLEGDRVLNMIYNASIPENTGIKIEFSNNNSTWVNHNNVEGSDDLMGGLESLDLRDLNTTSLYMRLNMTTSDPSITPRVYQLRFVTITDIIVGEGDTIIMGGSGIFWIILIIVVPIVAYVLKKG